MSTVHCYTNSQPLIDAPTATAARSRAGALSMIPTTTGAAEAVALVLPELEGRLSGSAIRVPTPNVSCIDLKFNSKRDCSVEEVNDAVRKAATEGALSSVLDYCEAPLVSIDFNHDPSSSNFAPEQTKVTGGNLVRVLSWYDNEWGFSNRMADSAVAMGALL